MQRYSNCQSSLSWEVKHIEFWVCFYVFGPTIWHLFPAFSCLFQLASFLCPSGRGCRITSMLTHRNHSPETNRCWGSARGGSRHSCDSSAVMQSSIVQSNSLIFALLFRSRVSWSALRTDYHVYLICWSLFPTIFFLYYRILSSAQASRFSYHYHTSRSCSIRCC